MLWSGVERNQRHKDDQTPQAARVEMLSLSYPVRGTVTLDPSGVRSYATIYLSNRYPVKFYRCHFIPFTPSNSKLMV